MCQVQQAWLLHFCFCRNEVSVCRSRSTDVEQQGRQRQEKIARFRRRKQLEESLQELRLHATRDNTDEEITVSAVLQSAALSVI